MVKRDVALYIMAMCLGIGAAYVLLPWVVTGELHGYEPRLWIRGLEYAFVLATLGLAIERLIAWRMKRWRKGHGK